MLTLNHRKRTLPGLALITLASLLTGSPRIRADVPPEPAPSLQFTPCQLANQPGTAVYNAECAELEVPENAAQQDGRRIRLKVARVPAISRRKAPDPLFLLAGGPGMAASALYANTAAAFGRIHRDRDIVLVDQRGTGGSNPLHCEVDDLEMLMGSEKQLLEDLKACLADLGTRADVAQYTTSVAVQDLERVRAALGYERINLYGSSYGTRVAQHYMRRFPDRTRAVILDGVIAPEEVLGPRIALDAEAALTQVLARCARTPTCSEAFGDPAEAYRELRTSLTAKPVKVRYFHPTTGEPGEMSFGAPHLATVLRLSLYTSEQAALLPLSLHLAYSEDNFAPLAGQFLLTTRLFTNVLAFGMHNSVVCAEDVPFYTPDRIEREELEKTFMGAAAVDSLREVCGLWPRGPMDADLHVPLKSDVPVLLLSGGNDPVTPPSSAEAAMKGLTNSLHLVLPDLGHGQIGVPCMDRVMASFLALGTLKGLDTSCTQRAKPMPFFTSLAGPTP